MTTAVRPNARSAAAATTTGEPRPADVLVVFGITGDLAKQMTFRSLYRLECRGLLDCPIVGVAVDDWTVADLRERARSVDRGHRGEGGRRAVRPLRGPSVLHLRRLRRHGDLRAAGRRDPRRPRAGLLPRDPALPLRQRRQGPLRRGSHPRGARRRREAVRPRPRVGPCAGRRDAPVHRRVPAVPHRPLPREDGRGGDPLPALRQRGLEPIWNREHVSSIQITMAESFGVEDRGHFYDPVGALRDVVVNHLMQVVARRHDGGAVQPRRARAQGRAAHALQRHPAGRSRPLRARPVRRLPRITGVARGLDHRDLRGAAPGHRQLALVGRADLHSDRQVPADHADRDAPGLPAPAARGLPRRALAPARADAARGQARSGHRRAAARRGAARP